MEKPSNAGLLAMWQEVWRFFFWFEAEYRMRRLPQG
jgi:hypothetical protein